MQSELVYLEGPLWLHGEIRVQVGQCQDVGPPEREKQRASAVVLRSRSSDWKSGAAAELRPDGDGQQARLRQPWDERKNMNRAKILNMEWLLKERQNMVFRSCRKILLQQTAFG